jgi:hypothetical protein
VFLNPKEKTNRKRKGVRAITLRLFLFLEESRAAPLKYPGQPVWNAIFGLNDGTSPTIELLHFYVLIVGFP